MTLDSKASVAGKIAADIQASIETKQRLLETEVATIEKMVQITLDCLRAGNKVLFCGNGGSAADSQHFAAEFVGRYEKERRSLPAIALTTDTSILTAVANDYSYDRVFERQVEGLGRKGDVLFAISTSGNSKNVIQGVRKAKTLGLYVIGFLGGDGGQLKSLVDLPLVVPSKKTSRIQESHIMIGHILCECVDELL